MSQRTIHRFAAAAALAAILFLGAASPAQAWDLGPTHAWQRLQDLWSKAVSVLWNWSRPPASEGRTSGDLVKNGPATDPDGSPKPGSTAPASGNSGG